MEPIPSASTTAETITWTQALYTDGATLSFEVFNGRSTTWGAFDRDMRIDSYASLPDLDSYSPATTVQNSCVTYGLNRVDSMQITQVRYFDSSGSLVAVDGVSGIVRWRPDNITAINMGRW